jgi:hypothetical protein
MPAPSVNGVHYQVRIEYLLHGQQCFNVLNFLSTGSQDLVDDLLLPILNCFTTALLPVLSNELKIVGADYKSLDGVALQEGAQTLSADNVGEITGNSLPSTNAAIISLRTAHPGRTGKGRMFLPGIDESRSANSQVDATFIAAALNFVICMAASYFVGDPPASNQFVWVVRSRKDNAFYPITNAIPKTIVGSMRSRKVAG